MPGYLLDLNHVAALFNEVQAVVARAREAGESQLRSCAITCGELEAGHRMTSTSDSVRRNEYTRWFNDKFLANVCNVTATTRLYYADIIEGILSKHPKAKKRQKTERYLVEVLGVDVNDIWMAACALEHGLVLVTRDGMDKIREATVSKGLRIENWMD